MHYTVYRTSLSISMRDSTTDVCTPMIKVHLLWEVALTTAARVHRYTQLFRAASLTVVSTASILFIHCLHRVVQRSPGLF